MGNLLFIPAHQEIKKKNQKIKGYEAKTLVRKSLSITLKIHGKNFIKISLMFEEILASSNSFLTDLKKEKLFKFPNFSVL